jgi:hypothetical protein
MAPIVAVWGATAVQSIQLGSWHQGIRLCTIELNKNFNFAVVSRRPIGLDSFINDGRMLKKAVSQ